jgi:hypothetical protein
MTTYNSYKAYFENIQQNSFALLGYLINSYGYGDSDRIIATMRSDIEYPVLWAEMPNYSYSYNQGFYIAIEGAIVILTGNPKDDDSAQNDSVNTAQAILQKIAAQMQQDGYIKGNSRMDIEPITKTMTDNGYGARLSFSIHNYPTTFLCP